MVGFSGGAWNDPKRPFSKIAGLSSVFYASYYPLGTLGHLLKDRRAQIEGNRVKKLRLESGKY